MMRDDVAAISLIPHPSSLIPLSAPPAHEFRRRFRRRRPEPPAAGPLLDADDPLLRTPKMARLEAALFVAGGPLSARRLAQLATLVDVAEARLLIDRLNDACDADGTPFRIERVATGYRMMTRPEYAGWLNRLHRRKSRLKLSPPAMETLTIIAYLQPITRADIEALRGVQCAEMLKQLMERELVRIAGEDESLGRPYLYGTTRTFLELFGLRHLDDLPEAESLRRLHPSRSQSSEPEPAAGDSEQAAAA